MRLPLKLLLVLVVALACLAPPGEARGQTTAVGQSLRRAFGPLTIECAVDGARVKVLVTLTLEGELVGQSVLTPDARVYDFDVATGAGTAVGQLRLDVAPAPRLSTLDANLSTQRGRAPPEPFRGSVATWISPDGLVYVDRTFDLSPDFEVQTEIRGRAKANVTVNLFAGSILLYSVSMTQASPVAVIADELVLGDVRVAAGMKFTLTIPTPQQKGQVVVEGKFQSRNIPITSISAAVATWSW